jgi:hypothetical protein
VDVLLGVEGEELDAGLEELADWLSGEPELRGLVRPAEEIPQDGELGVLSDTLVVALGSGGAVSVLASSLKAFFALPRRSDVRVSICGPDGRRVEIDAQRVGDVEALVREVLGRDG